MACALFSCLHWARAVTGPFAQLGSVHILQARPSGSSGPIDPNLKALTDKLTRVGAGLLATNSRVGDLDRRAGAREARMGSDGQAHTDDPTKIPRSKRNAIVVEEFPDTMKAASDGCLESDALG